ncbi:hypothetical protein, partial [Burkholderia multivorans]|uniref:hypothetical protein n=1 Tax=Burkholderia multivorans TaxID=87883 RepID=UPI001C26F11C
TALRLGQNFDAFHVMTRLTDRHKTIPYFKRVLVSSDTWGRSKHHTEKAQAASRGPCFIHGWLNANHFRHQPLQT